MISVTLNGASINYKPGVILNEYLSDQLSDGMIVFPQTEILDIEPLDQIIISDTSSPATRYMYVSTIKRNVTDYGTPKKYNYEVGLIGPEIILQRILLPNRSTTQHLTGTAKTIYTVLYQYLQLYAPTLSISPSLASLLNVACPDFQWNRPTLYEVINDMLSEVHAVVKMTDYTTLSYLNIDTNGSAVSITNLGEETMTQSIEDYASAIELEAQNAIIRDKNTYSINWVAAKNASESTTTTQNLQIAGDKPIYKPSKFWIALDDYIVDATNYITEKKAYDLLRTTNTAGVVTGDYKRNRIYFTQGSNVIDGLSFDETTWIGTASYPAIVNVWYNAYYDTYGSTYTLPTPMTDFYLDFLYYVVYTADETVKFESQKSIAPDHVSKIINNQDTSYVDIIQFSKKQQSIANAFSNPSITITGKYPNYYNVPNLGDLYDSDYKLVKKTLVRFDDFILFSGEFIKDYVNPYVFTGIKSQRRYTSIASANEAFESIHNTVIEVSVSHDSSYDIQIGKWFCLMGKSDHTCKVAHIVTYYANLTQSTDIGVSVSSYPLSDSIVCEFKMSDNQAAGVQVLSTDVWTTATLVKYLGAKYVKYVDSNGEFLKYDVHFYSYLDNPNMDSTNWATAVAEAREYPEINPVRLVNRIYSKTNVYRYKDNREITVEAYQFHVKPEEDIFLGNKFFTDSAAMHQDQTSDTTLYVAYSTSASQIYTKTDHEDAKGTIASSADLTYTITTNHIQIVVPGGSSVTWTNVISYALCDASGNIYIAVNGNDPDLYIKAIYI